MTKKFYESDLRASEELLDQLLDEVKAQSSLLSQGTKLVPGVEELQRLKETRLSFGSPFHNLTCLTESLLHECGIELSGFQRQQFNEKFNFYYMTLAVSMQPGRGVQFSRLECHLDFGPKGENEPIIHSIFPNSEWRGILQLGRKINLGLDGKLDWAAEMEGLESIKMPFLNASMKGKLANKNELKAYIAVPDYFYELGRTEIAAVGEGNSECFWRMDSPDLQKSQTVQLVVVFKVPKGVSSFDLTGIVTVEPDFKWLTANLGDVFDFLSDKLKRLLRLKQDERDGKMRLPVGTGETWTIKLPTIQKDK